VSGRARAARRRLLLAILVLGACEDGADEPFALWTIDDILDAAREGRSIAGMPAQAWAAAPGELLPWLSPPYAASETRSGSELPGLAVLPSFSEGGTVAYVVSEIWKGYHEVWVQPMYVAVTAFDENSPFQNALPGARPVFGVDVDSAFYSPYWEIFYFQVPADTPPDRYRSAQQILDAKLPMRPGPGIFCALAHQPFTVATPPGDVPRRPLSGEEVGVGVDPEEDVGWVDGRKVWTLTLGPDNFTWDEERYVREDPLFRLARRGPDGRPRPIGLPTVGGTGPIGSNTPADVRGGRPRFGALWRVVDVLVPDGAVVVVPPELTGMKALVEASGLKVAENLHPQVAEAVAGGAYTGRVARSAGCFADPAQFPEGCRFLDSQAAIEDLAGNAFFPTDVLAACPLVGWDGVPVP
jgi:hypothetical protein